MGHREGRAVQSAGGVEFSARGGLYGDQDQHSMREVFCSSAAAGCRRSGFFLSGVGTGCELFLLSSGEDGVPGGAAAGQQAGDQQRVGTSGVDELAVLVRPASRSEVSEGYSKTDPVQTKVLGIQQI